MSDKLEKYIKDNRKDFDSNELPNDLWAKIESKLNAVPKKKTNIKFIYLSIAASVVVVLGLMWLYTLKVKNQNIDIADVNPVFAEREERFTGLITEKRDSLAIFASANPNLYKKFTQDLIRLDEDYERLKLVLKNTPNQELVVKAMVKNREIQLQLLKQQLSIINKVDDYRRVNQI